MISWAKFNRQFLTVPNFLSIVRGFLGIWLPFLILSPQPHDHVLAAIVFTIAAFTDLFDGIIARKFNQISEAGKFLDPVTDKILILLPLIAFVKLDFYSVWWIVPVFLRELAVTFCRIGWMIQGEVVAAERLGKYKTVAQVVLIASSLWMLLSPDYAFFSSTASVAEFCLYLSLFLGLILTVVSGCQVMLANISHCRSEAFAKYVSAFGVGLLPRMPGTWGSILALVPVLLAGFNIWLYLVLFAGVIWLGHWSFNRLSVSNGKDPQFVTLDEVAGIFVTFLGLPLTGISVLCGFLLFRIFDIFKPFPLKRLEKLPGWWGVLADDLGAGCYAWVIMWIIFH